MRNTGQTSSKRSTSPPRPGYSSAISWIAGETTNAYVIVGIIFFIPLIGFVQEYKAERAMEALQEMVAPEANVLRGGRMKQVPAGCWTRS